MPTLQQLEQELQQLKAALAALSVPGRHYFVNDVQIGAGKRLIGAIFGGSVSSAGVATNLPLGWTSSKTATGNYTITHNLNTTAYAVTITAFAAASPFKVANVLTQTSTTFTVDTTLAGADTDSAFYFILMLL